MVWVTGRKYGNAAGVSLVESLVVMAGLLIAFVAINQGIIHYTRARVAQSERQALFDLKLKLVNILESSISQEPAALFSVAGNIPQSGAAPIILTATQCRPIDPAEDFKPEKTENRLDGIYAGGPLALSGKLLPETQIRVTSITLERLTTTAGSCPICSASVPCTFLLTLNWNEDRTPSVGLGSGSISTTLNCFVFDGIGGAPAILGECPAAQ